MVVRFAFYLQTFVPFPSSFLVDHNRCFSEKDSVRQVNLFCILIINRNSFFSSGKTTLETDDFSHSSSSVFFFVFHYHSTRIVPLLLFDRMTTSGSFPFLFLLYYLHLTKTKQKSNFRNCRICDKIAFN